MDPTMVVLLVRRHELNTIKTENPGEVAHRCHDDGWKEEDSKTINTRKIVSTLCHND